jgi:hypothetical protein
MNTPGTISAVIVNYNAGSDLRELISGLTRAQRVTGIVVVDNASRDDSIALIDAVPKPVIELVRNDENRGFAVACNQGAALARGTYLLFINPDCRISGDALEQLADVLDARPDAGMAGPLIRNPDGSEQRGCRRRLPSPQRALMRVLGLGSAAPDGTAAGFDLTGTPLPDTAVEIEAISGACMLVRRTAFERVGGWDEDYFLHCEDLDLCMRLGLDGSKILFVPDANVIHSQGVSSRRRRLFVLWHKHRGMWRYFSKFQRAASPAWLVLMVWSGIWSRFLILAPGACLASLGAGGRA